MTDWTGRPIKVKISWCSERGDPMPLPHCASDGAAGLDVAAAETITLAPGTRMLIPTGWRVEIPPGYEIQVRARSGISFKKCLLLTNGVGTIDADFRGEILIPLANMGSSPVTLERGERIAQLVLQKLPIWEWEHVPSTDLAPTKRSSGGFGSTGTQSTKNT